MTDHDSPVRDLPSDAAGPTASEATGLSRRRLLLGLGSLGALSVGATACGDVSAPGSGTKSGGKLELTMFVFLGGDLGTMPKEFIEEWESSHPNVKVNIYEESNQVGYPKMVSTKKTNPKNPLVNLGFFNASTTEQGVLDDMWHRLDYAALKNAGDIRGLAKRSDNYGIGIGTDQIGLLYNTEKVTPAPRSWQELWDPSNRGKVTMFGFPWYAVFAAAHANGGGLDDMEPGWRAWEENAENIRTLVTSNPQYLNVLSSGSAPLTGYFNGTGKQWIDDGAPLKYVPPEEGAVPVPVDLQVVSGQTDAQLEACQEIVDAMISPKWCARWAETSIEVPANTKAKLPEDLARLPAFGDQAVAQLLDVDYAIVGKNTSAWTDRWNRDVVSRI